MNLSALPDHLLVHLFSYLHDLQQLIQLSHVNSRWRNLIKFQLNTTEQLDVFMFVSTQYHYFVEVNYRSGYVHSKNFALIKKINFSKLLPNLKVLRLGRDNIDFCFCKTLENALITSKSLIGIKIIDDLRNIENCFCPFHHHELLAKYCDNLKYFDCISEYPINEKFFEEYKFGRNLRHLGVLDFKRFFLFDSYSQMESIESIEITLYEDDLHTFPEIPTNRRKYSSVKQLSLCYPYLSTFKFLDDFPNVERLLIQNVEYESKNRCNMNPINESRIQYHSVRTLYLQWLFDVYHEPHNPLVWIKFYLSFFPNCKNILIRFPKKLTTNNLKEIISMQPTFNSIIIKGEELSEVDSIKNYCRSIGRQFQIYQDSSLKISSPNASVDLNIISTDYFHKTFLTIASIWT